MATALFPASADNIYRGRAAGLWLFGLLVFLKCGISLGSVFNAHQAASSADGIPLDTYPPGAAREVLTTFMLLGWSNFAVCVIAIVVLIRYRALVPLMFAVWLFYDVGKRLIFLFVPLERGGGSSGAIINRVMLGVMLVGFVLSLWPRREARRS
jgi:hypothetical protein